MTGEMEAGLKRQITLPKSFTDFLQTKEGDILIVENLLREVVIIIN